MKYLKKFNENIDYSKEEFLDEVKDLIPDILDINGINYSYFNSINDKKWHINYACFQIHIPDNLLLDNIEIFKSDFQRIYHILSNIYKITFEVRISVINSEPRLEQSLSDVFKILDNKFLNKKISDISIIFEGL